MNVNSIFSATPWNKVDPTKLGMKITMDETSTTDDSAPAKEAPSGEDEITTKISVNAEGERVMIFMQGDKVIKTIKIGQTDQMSDEKALNNEQQQYVDNGTSDIGVMLNVSS